MRVSYFSLIDLIVNRMPLGFGPWEKNNLSTWSLEHVDILDCWRISWLKKYVMGGLMEIMMMPLHFYLIPHCLVCLQYMGSLSSPPAPHPPRPCLSSRREGLSHCSKAHPAVRTLLTENLMSTTFSSTQSPQHLLPAWRTSRDHSALRS